MNYEHRSDRNIAFIYGCNAADSCDSTVSTGVYTQTTLTSIATSDFPKADSVFKTQDRET